MSTTWFTSDLHFGHSRIIEMSYRPFESVEDMNQSIINNWNGVVDERDHVWIIGDAIMGTFAENVHLLGRLNGNIHLVPGNHDRIHPAYGEKREHKVTEFRALYEQYVTIEPLQIDFEVEGIDVTVCHFPFDGDHTDEVRYSEYRPIDRGQFLIHGHTHGMWKTNGRQIDVGIDAWNYTPVSIETVLDFMLGEEV